MKYTPEQVEDQAERVGAVGEDVGKTANILTDYADLREQIERAREGVTDEVERVAIKAAEVWARENGFVSYMAPTGYLRAALQAVAHLLPSQPAQVELTARPCQEAAERAISNFLSDELGQVPSFTLAEDGEPSDGEKCGWSFWVTEDGCEDDTTSYVHADLSIEWYGTSWAAPTAEPVAQGEAVPFFYIDKHTAGAIANPMTPSRDGVRAYRPQFPLPDGEFVPVYLQAAQPRALPETWRPMETAPRDGTMLRLLVQFEEHATEDTTEPAPTIGAYEEGADGWQFAGGCWSHDHFTEGKGTPVGWLPMLDDHSHASTEQPAGRQGEAVACRYRFSDDNGGWFGWHYSDQPTKKTLPGDTVQVQQLYTHPAAPMGVPDERKLVGYVWPNEADYDHIHRCLGVDGDPEIRRIPAGAVGVYAMLAAAPSQGESA